MIKISLTAPEQYDLIVEALTHKANLLIEKQKRYSKEITLPMTDGLIHWKKIQIQNMDLEIAHINKAIEATQYAESENRHINNS